MFYFIFYWYIWPLLMGNIVLQEILAKSWQVSVKHSTEMSELEGISSVSLKLKKIMLW